MMRRVMLMGLIALAIVTVAPARGQEPGEVPTIPFEGMEVFTYLLKTRRLQPIPTVQELGSFKPEATLAIVFGQPDVLRPQGGLASLKTFQERGGAVLIATDYPGPLPGWDVRVPLLKMAQRRQFSYQQMSDCPLISALEAGAPAAIQPLQHGLATNRPSYLRPTRAASGTFEPLANFDQCYPVGDISNRDELDQWLADTHTYILFTPQGRGRQGRALLIAGHGMFTNGMLLQTEADNFKFTVDCLRWLVEGPGGRPRTHALFVVDGTAVSSFDTELKPPLPPIPPIPTPTIQLVNQLLRGIEREGLLFRFLQEVADVRAAARVGLVALTVALLLYGAKKLGEQRHLPETAARLLVGPYAAPPDTDALVRQRFRSQVEQGALWQEGRAMVRAWFAEVCGIAPDDWDRASERPTPAALATGGWWQRQRLRRQVEQLAEFAGHRNPTAFTWVQLVRLTRTLQALSAATHEGRLRFPDCSAGEKS